MRALLLPLLLLLSLGGPHPDRAAAAAHARNRFESAQLAFRQRLPTLLAPVREAFARARAGAPDFALWSNSSWTGLNLACSAAADWCDAPETGAESRVAQAVRERFEEDVLSPVALEDALRQTLEDFRVELDASRLEASLGVEADCGDLLARADAPAPLRTDGLERIPAAIADRSELAAGSAILYRAVDLGADRLAAGILAPLLLRLAARLGLRVGSLGAGIASFGVALLATMILEYIYDCYTENRIVAALGVALDQAEADLLCGDAGLTARLQEFSDRQWQKDAERVAGRLKQPPRSR